MDGVNSLGIKGKMLTVAVLSIILAFSLSAIATTDEVVGDDMSGKCGEDLTWKITNSEDQWTLEISGQGNMTDFAAETDVPWNGYRTTITKIVLSDGMTSIGSYAFKGFTNVTDPFEINDSITHIGAQALANSKFSSIIVDPSSNNFKSDDIGALYNLSMTYLIQLSAGSTIDNYLTPATVTKIGTYAFMGCSLKEFDVASNVKTVEANAFASAEYRSVVFGTGFTADLSQCGVTFYDTDGSSPITDVKGCKFTLKSDKLTKNTTAPAKYTVSFTNCAPIEGITDVQNFPIVLPTVATHAEKNLTFVGWLDPAKNPVEYSYTGSSDITLTADWMAKITFNSDGGTAVSPILGYYGTIVEKPADPTKKGLTFYKWKDGAGNEITWPYTLDENITFTAIWKVQVTFDSQGGSDVPSMMIDKGKTIAELPEPSRAGFAFTGWYDALEGGTKVTSEYVFNETKTVYAKWTAGAFKIRFLCDVKGYAPILMKEEIVQGGGIITAPEKNTFKLDGMTYYVDNWNGFTEGMTASEDKDFYGIYVKAVDITAPIEGKSCIFTSESDAVYVLSNSFKMMTDKAKQDPEFTYTVVFNNGEITFDSTFLKAQKANNIKVGIYKLNNSDVPSKVISKAGSNPELFRVLFGNETTLANPLTITLYHELTAKQVKERLCIYSISEDGATVTNLNGSPDSTGITFDAKNLIYFSVKYDNTSYLIKYINEGELYYYYLVEKEKEIPVPSTIPTKEPTVMYNYVFKEWSGYVPGMKAFVDQVFTASYDTEIRLYTIDFVVEAQGERVVVDTQHLGYGAKITAPSQKSVDIGGKAYEIVSWQGLTAETVVTGDTTFHATIKEAANTSWVYIVVCLAAVLIIVEGLYLYNKKFRD